jgi:transcriptional regulator of acetoin/glycerol metabolism
MEFPLPITRSWERCASRRLSQMSKGVATAQSLNAHQVLLLDQVRSLIEDLHQFIDQPGFALALADGQGELLDVQGDPAIVALAEQSGLVPRVLASEEQIGTNAIDLALREAQPMRTCGNEHYCLALHPLAIAAAPIFAVNGQALGVLAVIARAEAFHPHTLGLAIAAVQALQHQLRTDELIAEANDHLAELYAALEAMSDGLIFVGPQGEIRRINSRAAQVLGVHARSVSGRRLNDVLAPPTMIQVALVARQDILEQELLWQGRKAPLTVVCSLHQVWDRGRRYLGGLIIVRPTQSVHQLVQRVTGTRAEFTFGDIVGQSQAMGAALHRAHLAANSSGCALICGESGVGKDLFAQAIHNASARAGGPFVRLHCSAIPRSMLSSELFGIEGDERAARPGKLELAHGGTLYLEEISALPFELQTSLLRTIEMRHSMRSGSARAFPVDVRIIAADGPDLAQQVAEGRFRPDLYARLSATVVELPALRERGDDLLLLINQLLRAINERLGKQVVLAPEALQALRAYHWPGNVRELELVLERLLDSMEKTVIEQGDLPPAVARAAQSGLPPTTASLADTQAMAEYETILRAGRQAGGHLGRAAALLGVSRVTLWRKMSRYGVSREQFWRDLQK